MTDASEVAFPTHITLGLGSNLGDRAGYLRAAVRSLADVVHDLRLSPVYETLPFGPADQPKYLNAVVTGTTQLTATELLARVKRIERELGRQEREHWGAREIDIDIIFFGSEAVNSEALAVPHPSAHLRSTVLVPLADIAPDLRHPTLERTVRELLEGVDGSDCTPHPIDWFEVDALPSHLGRNPVTDLLDCGVTALRTCIDVDLVSSALDCATTLLTRSTDELRPFSRPAGTRLGGYIPPGGEYVGKHGADTERSSFDLIERDQRFPPSIDATPLTALRTRLTDIGQALISALDPQLTHPVFHATHGAQHPLRLTRYHNARVAPQHVLFPAHIDFTLLTLIPGSGQRGLELFIDGRWRDATLPLGDVVIFRGSYLRPFRPDLAPIRHRVMATGTGRPSAILFLEPRPETILPDTGERYDERLLRRLQKIHGLT